MAQFSLVLLSFLYRVGPPRHLSHHRRRLIGTDIGAQRVLLNIRLPALSIDVFMAAFGSLQARLMRPPYRHGDIAA